jgi:MFS family permease
MVAYPLLVLALTDSPATAGLVGTAQTLPFLLMYVPAGAVVDRWDRKRIMLVADVGRAIAMATIVLAMAVDRLTIAQILVVALIEGTLFVFFDLAEGAALPHIVPKEQLPTAMAQNQARVQGASLAGQPLGGFLFGIGRAYPFLFDAITYVVSFVTLLFVRPRLQEARSKEPWRMRTEIAEGFRWLRNQSFLMKVIGLVAVSNFGFNALILVLIVRAKDQGASPALIGTMLAFMGAGAILGAILAPKVQRTISTRVVILAALWLWAIEFFALIAMPTPLTLGVVVGIGDIGGPIFNVVTGAYVYALVPDRLQGRVRAVAKVIAWGTIPFGALAAGFLLEAFGATTTLVVLGALMVVVAAVGTIDREVRNAPELQELLAK